MTAVTVKIMTTLTPPIEVHNAQSAGSGLGA
jgi:hypothetical protein